MSPNEMAFLDMLAVSEGTAHLGDRGYNALVGGKLFVGYAHHPGIRVALPRRDGETLYSTAAGRYQFKLSTWNDVAQRLHLSDFSPAAQDAACLELVRECAALDDVRLGRVAVAVEKCRHIWASLPGAGYGQRENALSALMSAYLQAGGVVA